jgi:Asp-tRNA(Asn)/Glu-tRNA(Gln) amidotransferase A subunit family amidase
MIKHALAPVPAVAAAAVAAVALGLALTPAFAVEPATTVAGQASQVCTRELSSESLVSAALARAKADAPVVERLRKAGAVVIAKTNMHELAFGISGYNPTFQTGPQPGVRNAYDSTRSAGGSSSGTGAALGARVVLAGLGTDTGGSVRIPCAFNGCASLRPTVGRYPGAGIAPISHTRDTAGPMARSVADVELLDRVITGAKAVKPWNLKKVRLGLVIPRKLPGPNNTLVDAKPAYEAAMKKSRPELQALYRRTFNGHGLGGIVFPTVPSVAFKATPASSSVEVFMASIQNTDPGSNAGVPGLQIPMALGASSKLPVGMEIDGPAGSDRRLLQIGLAIEAVLGALPAPTR